ncbi:MAG: 1-deoxy-D-xylulose-5-phosphate reductoisomerase [Holosporales bacterium]|jgi:1-deoxy-D-xylulose-5-phosphate reductoisomerase|nr:1-deoxy-D-xylulose-5-phosphate reductoisomerase [Holosporales bacterium]
MALKTCSIFGSTGTIGQKAAQVAMDNYFEIVALTGGRNFDLLIKQALKYRPKYIGIAYEEGYSIVREAVSGIGIEVVFGEEINELASMAVDCCVMAISGRNGAAIGPTLACLGNARRLAIASKEAIIAGGKFLVNRAKLLGTEILPIDSEHSAIFQCLSREDKTAIDRVILTASGGPFLGLEESELSENATIQAALHHPKWKMGPKITIDSATLINKAFEIIEAAILFDIEIDKITPIIHPESIIHGLIEFNDKTLKAVLSTPDMILPISFAMNYPCRKSYLANQLDLCNIGKLQFIEQKEWQKRNMNLAYQAFNEKKLIAFSISDEIAVSKFLRGQIKFEQIYEFIIKTLNHSECEKIESYDDIKEIITACQNFDLQ